MIRLILGLSRWVVAALVVVGVARGADLSQYRGFKLGTDLPAVLTATGLNADHVKTVHSRPALIQELEWHPQPLGPSSRTDAAKQVVFSFFDGQLFLITISYDRSATEGLTTADYIDAISTTYGTPSPLDPPKPAVPARYGEEEQIVAQWQDSQYRFELVRSEYGPTFRLTGVLKKMEEPSRVALLEAARLDHEEAPQREAEQKTKDDETERARLEKARRANKPTFRP